MAQAKKAASKAAPAKKAAPAAKKAAPATKAAAPAKKAAPVKKAEPAPKKAPAPAAKKAAPPAPAAKKAAAPAPAAKKAAPAPARKGDFDAKFLAEQKALLLEERAEYVEQADHLKAEAEQLAREAEPGDVQFDEESGEGGNTNLDRERDLVLSAQARQAVEEIDHALEKIAAKSYGYCENCGQPIPKPRLKAIPHARLCIGCKSGGLSRR